MANNYDMDKILSNYAEIIIKVGLNLQAGQRLFITATPLDTAPLVRKVTEAAYKIGSPLVSTLWRDEASTRIRYENAPKDSFEEFPTWEADGALTAAKRGDAFLYILGSDPELLKEQDQKLVAISQKVASKLAEPVSIMRGSGKLQWLIVCPPSKSWAGRVFPHDDEELALEKLWDGVIKATRLDHEDPVAFWKDQKSNLNTMRAVLSKKRYEKLHLYGPGTDLTLGLPKGHSWQGGSQTSVEGIEFIPNLPTEEVFTSPHCAMADGMVTATKPLSFRGKLIENFNMTFKDGKVVEFSAEKGEDALRELLATDDEAKMLGEVALVPHLTPISQLGLVFLNTLYDENASSHLALGRSFRFCMDNANDLSKEDYAAAGGNNSLVHVDFMFGSAELNVDGFLANGEKEAIMQNGEWAENLN